MSEPKRYNGIEQDDEGAYVLYWDAYVPLAKRVEELVAEETDSPLMTVDEIVAVAEGARLALELKKVVNANDELEDTITRLKEEVRHERERYEDLSQATIDNARNLLRRVAREED